MPAGSATASAAFVVRVPAPATATGSAMRSQYISPSTQSLAVTVGGEPTVVANLTPSSPNCVPASGPNPLTCTVTVTAPVGTDTFTVTMYDGLNASGNVLSKGSVTANVVANQTTPVNVVTGGTVCSIQVTLGNPAPPQGTSATIPVTVTVRDAAGNVIIAPGSYSAPIALQDSDATYTSLSTTSVTSPGQSVTLAYNGGPLTTATISASSAGIPATKITNATLKPTGSAPAIAAIAVSVANASLTPRVPSSTALTVTARDAAGNIISGTYPATVTLSTTNAALSFNPKTVTASGQPVTVSYSGSTLVVGNVSVSATAPNVPPAKDTAAPFTPKTPCLPTFTPTNLYVVWDTTGVQDLYRYAPPYTGTPTPLNTTSYAVYMTIDPTGRIFIAQANTSGYPGPSANVVYFSPPYTAPQVAVTPANLDIYGTALDDKGNLFVTGGPIFSAPGPVPATGSFYATPAVLPNSPTGIYSLNVDNYCNLVASGANGTIYVFGTTGQPGGGYGQVTPIVNTKIGGTTGVGGTTLDLKGNIFFVVGSQIYELAPPYTQAPTALINIPGAGITSMAVDTSGNIITADYSNNRVEEIKPPYTSYTTIISGVLSDVAGVVIGP